MFCFFQKFKFKMMITKIKKRNGEVVDFDNKKIENAIKKAINAVGEREYNVSILNEVVSNISLSCDNGTPVAIESIQDIVENTLIKKDYIKEAKAFIIYRENQRRLRDEIEIKNESIKMIDSYLDNSDWEVNENANTTFSLQGLNHFGYSYLSKKYWLNKIYSKEIRDANENGDLHIHDLNGIACYCEGWSLYDLLQKGFKGVPGKVEASPAKHFRAALGQAVNFVYSMSGECMGAVALSNFDTLLAPFIYYDKLSYEEVKQSLQEFMFNMVVSTRTGFQAAFSNITLDLTFSSVYAKRPVMIGGKLQDKTYSEFQNEMNIFNKAFFETMMEGDATKQVFTFPIPTINITSDFDWDNPALEPMWEANAKYGVCYFANYINSDMDPNDVLSMCCRLKIDKSKLHNRGGGGLFGSGDKTGSIGVVTINMPRIGYLSKTKEEYFDRLGKTMDIAKNSLEMKRKIIEKMADKGLYPYTKYYLVETKKQFNKYFINHFSTIGLVGMNESLLNFIGKDIGTQEGVEFTLEVMTFMRNKLVNYQEETGNFYNLEATPAESTAHRLALKDKKYFSDIITAGTEETPYYTNSTQLPVNYTEDVFEAIQLQDKITSLYTGGSVHHIFVGERLSDIGSVKSLIKKIFTKFKMPYISITPTFSICSEHGYLNGEQEKCPQCGREVLTFTRVVGYLRPIKQFNKGKQEEYKDRKEYKI